MSAESGLSPRVGTASGGERPRKQPYFIHRKDGEPLAFAGLWETWKVPDDRPENEKPLVDAICGLPQVLECHHVTGDWSYLLKLRLAEVAEIETVLADTIKQFPGAIRTHTVLALSSRKDTAAILGLST